uniref:Myosin motor domain-containing protein n=1 Tax=Ditylum brightwellii TaxID=49249 RepID=A0A7S4VR71_9STRA
MTKEGDVNDTKSDAEDPGDGQLAKESLFYPHVFITDDKFTWLPAKLTKPVGIEDNTATVELDIPGDWSKSTVDGETVDRNEIREVNLKDYPDYELPKQNIDRSGKLLAEEDMSDLPNLHEASVLYNLKDRHYRNLPYTRVGDITVAMNPFHWIDGLYSDEKRRFYNDNLIWNAIEKEREMKEKMEAGKGDLQDSFFNKPVDTFAPHVYETSAYAYHDLMTTEQNQSILVSGESGAGKTETVKIVLRHIATIENSISTAACPTEDTGDLEQPEIVSKILKVEPIFEAFGNAVTRHNNNSSRFGKFTSIYLDKKETKRCGFESVYAVTGSSFVTYLLEKTRVVSHGPGERSFHIFYHLLNAPEEFKASVWDGLKDTTQESFSYLGSTEINQIDDRSESQLWEAIQTSLAVIGVEGEKMISLMRALCIVLQLGNLTFSPDPQDAEGSVISSQDELLKLSHLMGIDPSVIENAITKRKVKAGFDWIETKVTAADSKDSCDALAKKIYAQLFAMLKENINESTAPADIDANINSSDHKYGCISMLDLFGFESFKVNRFEQLCINYANERIQHRYVVDNFLSVKDEYEREGIETFDVSDIENSAVLKLLEGRMGVFSILNDECVRPKGNAESFVYKLKTIYKDSYHLVVKNLDRPWEFSIKHFAATVKYDARNFVARNNDQLPKDVLECVCKCTNDIIHSRFETIASERAKQPTGIRRKMGAASATVCTKFRNKIIELMEFLLTSKIRYIRCIKPNENSSPHTTDHLVTMRQLGSAGLVKAVNIAREIYPNSLSHDKVWVRFRCLTRLNIDENLEVKEKVSILLNEQFKDQVSSSGCHNSFYRVGATKVFFKPGQLELIESRRATRKQKAATIINNRAKAYRKKKDFQTLKRGAILVQALARRNKEQTELKKKKDFILAIQCAIRLARARRTLQKKKEDRAATIIQNSQRSRIARKEYTRYKNAADMLLRAMKRKLNRDKFDAALAVVVERARMDERRKKILSKLANIEKDDILKECEVLIQYLGDELFDERGHVYEVRAKLRKEQEKNAQLRAKNENLGANTGAQKIEKTQLVTQNKNLTRRLSSLNQSKNTLNASLRDLRLAESTRASEQRKSFALMQNEMSTRIDQLNADFDQSFQVQDGEVTRLKRKLELAEKKHKDSEASLKLEHQGIIHQYEEDLSSMLSALEECKSNHEREYSSMKESLVRQIEESEAAVCAQQLKNTKNLPKTIEDIDPSVECKYCGASSDNWKRNPNDGSMELKIDSKNNDPRSSKVAFEDHRPSSQGSVGSENSDGGKRRSALYRRNSRIRGEKLDPKLKCYDAWQPNMHESIGGCERCVFYLTDEERRFFDVKGHHPRVNLVRGGCSPSCPFFPRTEHEHPVRICHKCYHQTHVMRLK